MLRDPFFFSSRGKRFKKAVLDIPALTARIRRTELGVRIKFSDGRTTWLDRDTRISENYFLGSVCQWAKRQGAASIEMESE